MATRNQTSTTPREYLNAEQTANLLQIPERTLADWRYRDIGPAFVRTGRSVRYRRSDLDAWLEARTQRPDPRTG